VKRIVTGRLIAAPPERVWAVLADFRRYAEWNPLNIRADGYARAGARVPMRFVDAGGGKGRIIAQTVTVTVCEPPRRLAWVGRVPLLFLGRHWFTLEPADGGTMLRHGETLAGLIPLAFSAERLDRQRRAYEAMNDALARRVADLAPVISDPPRASSCGPSRR
jgi:hypothetical protein